MKSLTSHDKYRQPLTCGCLYLLFVQRIISAWLSVWFWDYGKYPYSLTKDVLYGNRRCPWFPLCIHVFFQLMADLCWDNHSFDEPVVSAARHTEKSTHFTDWVFFSVTEDNLIFYWCFHFPSVSERKSRISSFSISNLLIYISFSDSSYRNCANLLNCWMEGGNSFPSFLGHPKCFGPAPESVFCRFRLCRLKKSCIFSYGNPNFSAICRWLNPCSLSLNIYFSYILMCLYSLGIKISPMVAISLFYHRRVFLSIVRFLRFCLFIYMPPLYCTHLSVRR